MKLDKRRRREHKTNYHKRLILLKGKKPRLVVRKSNRYIFLQIVESSEAKDKVLHSVSTKDLLKKGWPESKKGSLKSLGAAYLTGLLLGKKVAGSKKTFILDTGLIPNTAGSRVYAALKGFADSGADINYNEKVFPSEEMIFGRNEDIIKKVKEAIGK
jgi:large subunit ribosomal protein L18